MFDPAAARRQMVESQLRPSRILDPRVLGAIGDVPRELFVPDRLQAVAYVDEDVEVAPGRHLMEPRIFGRLVQELNIQPGDRVLDVGISSGYSTAVLARLAQTVVGLEVDANLATRAGRMLARLGVTNAVVTVGGLPAGAPAHAPFQAILLEGSVEEVPEALRAQLADGGRLAGVLVRNGVGKASIVERHGQAFGVRELMDAATPRLPGFGGEPGFVF